MLCATNYMLGRLIYNMSHISQIAMSLNTGTIGKSYALHLTIWVGFHLHPVIEKPKNGR